MNNIEENVIEFKNVSIEYDCKVFVVPAIEDVSLNIKRGKITALVGESGCGKTTIVSSIINCISKPGQVVRGNVIYNTLNEDGSYSSMDLYTMNEDQWNKFRWEKVSMVFQASQNTLNPVIKIFDQFYETYYYHHKNVSKEFVREKVIKLLSDVRLGPEVLKRYPHELSGGMKQRVMIAFSMLLDPEVIILDEPTTALDVITQDYILKILKEINQKRNMTFIILTHDIGVVARFSDYMAVFYSGRLMEYGSTREIFKHKLHPYTRGLINSTPSIISDEKQMPIKGSTPSLLDLPNGCVFNPRCDNCINKCTRILPRAKEIEKDHIVACHLFDRMGE